MPLPGPRFDSLLKAVISNLGSFTTPLETHSDSESEYQPRPSRKKKEFFFEEDLIEQVAERLTPKRLDSLAKLHK